MLHVLITGANRGLGLEFVRQYLDNGYAVTACCRSPESATELAALAAGNDQLRIEKLDAGEPSTANELAKSLGGRPIDLLINNAGVFGPKPKGQGDHRQDFGQIDYSLWLEVLQVNTLFPVKVAEALLDNVRASRAGRIVTITSRLGSIAETSGGLYMYRSSKAAVNMAMRNLAQELAQSSVTVALLNPGWVKTDMGGPEGLLDADESIRRMRHVIESLSVEQSGNFFEYDGSLIDW